MSIQFRSRTRSIFDYGARLSSTGKCCYSDGTNEITTFNQCFANSGYWQSDVNADCPEDTTKGYCCSCTFLSSSQKQEVVNNLPYSTTNPFFQDSTFGIQENITKCECDRIGGNWSEAVSSFELCKKTINGNQTVDTRIPNACCSFIIQNGAPIGVTCQNVCNARECANLVLVEAGPDDPFTDTVFKPNEVCGKSLLSGINPATCDDGVVTSRLLSANAAFSNDPLGPCYTLNPTTLEYDCTVSPEYLCSAGYWVDPGEEEVMYCSDSFAPKSYTKTNSYINPISYTQAEFNSLGLSIGDEFQGGIYIGTFTPKKSNTTSYSRVYGALNYAKPQSNVIDVSDESPYKKWALIVDKSFFTARILSASDANYNFNTSYYDGFLNCYGDPPGAYKITSRTINTFAGKMRKGFVDYYIPSIVEMMFFAEQHRTNTALSNQFTLNKRFVSTTFVTDKYLSAIPVGQNEFDGYRFFYGQDLSSGKNYGRVYATTINSEANFMLFRRIVIE